MVSTRIRAGSLRISERLDQIVVGAEIEAVDAAVNSIAKE
jgi:hypothetical protein